MTMISCRTGHAQLQLCEIVEIVNQLFLLAARVLLMAVAVAGGCGADTHQCMYRGVGASFKVSMLPY